MRRRRVPRRERGVALIIALVLVALATILAWKISFDGYLERRRSVGMLAADQALQFGLGAEALAADVLARDAQETKQDTLAEPWAQAAGQNFPITPPNDPEGEPIGALQGAIEDVQGRFNLNNLGHLLADGKPDPVPLEQLQRLLQSLGMETKWAALARDWIDQDNLPTDPDGGEDSLYTAQTPPYLTGNWPMSSTSELLALPGFGVERFQKLAPFVTALPLATAKINICTAPAFVLESLDASLHGEFSTNADALLIGRKTGCFPDMNTLQNIVGAAKMKDIQPLIADSTSYFQLTTHVTLGTTEFTLYSLLLRNNGRVTPLLRTFGTN